MTQDRTRLEQDEPRPDKSEIEASRLSKHNSKEARTEKEKQKARDSGATVNQE